LYIPDQCALKEEEFFNQILSHRNSLCQSFVRVTTLVSEPKLPTLIHFQRSSMCAGLCLLVHTTITNHSHLTHDSCTTSPVGMHAMVGSCSLSLLYSALPMDFMCGFRVAGAVVWTAPPAVGADGAGGDAAAVAIARTWANSSSRALVCTKSW